MEIGISPYIVMALSFMSLSILYVVFTEAPTESVVVDTIIFILGTLLSFMIMMLLDINRPFEGYWSIKTAAFSLLLDQLKKEKLEEEKANELDAVRPNVVVGINEPNQITRERRNRKDRRSAGDRRGLGDRRRPSKE